MRSLAIFLTAAVVTLTACGYRDGSSALPSNAGVGLSRSAAPAASATPYVYTCQSGTASDCLIYSSDGKLLKTLKKHLQSPLGVAAGKDGRFYVANELGNNVLVYSAGGGKLLRTLDNGGNTPIDVAVYQDEVAVANLHVMTFFAAGATQPTRTLKDSNAFQGSGAAFDSLGNCYWSFVNQKSAAQVDEFKHCKGRPHNLHITPGSPYGVAFDAAGNLYYTSYSSQTQGVFKCTGVTSCGLAYGQFIDPQYLNFSGDFKDLWVSDPGNYQSGAALYEINVKTGKVLQTITAGLSFFNPPSGVAAGPGPL
jgi:hypothetical protein